MKKTYKIEVDCANCAAKIEDAIGKMETVNKARVNFMTQKMTLDVDGDIDQIVKEVEKVGKKVDSDFEVYA
ncbi:MAG: cation transporter [Erysipelotrichaceae bacterium]|nr:cation transporter [Erysipelotrichaceae bacterium]